MPASRSAACRLAVNILGALGLAGLLAAGACRREPPPAPDAVARVAGEEIRYGRFAAYSARAIGEADASVGSDTLSALFDQFLDEQLLARLAADRGLVAPGDGRGGPRRAVAALLAAAGNGGTSGDAEIAAYYAAHRGEFARPERVRLRQILVEDRATAESAAKEIAAGADFAAVAQRLTRAPSPPGAGGGDYSGELSRADLPPAYAETLFGLQPGGVSRVIPAQYGFHLFQVVEHLPAAVLPLAQVEGEIRARLARQGADRRLAALVAESRKRYNVEVYRRNLPFDYEGDYRESTEGQSKARR